MTYRRLRNTDKKMDQSQEFAKQYTAQMENLFTKGCAVPCDGSEDKSVVCWYLPLFPGKARLVFDVAARSHGTSLTDELLEGHDLLLSLLGILFRFREKKVGVTEDIQEMFLRIKIRSKYQAVH